MNHENKNTGKQPESQTSMEGFALALDAAQLGTWDLDIASGHITRSLRHDQIFGYDVLQPSWTREDSARHIRQEDLTAVQSSYREALETGFWRTEFFIRRTDDELCKVAIVGSVLYNERGKPERIVGVISDVTQREHAEFGWHEKQARLEALKRSEEALRQTEQFTETVLNSVTDGVTVYDSDLRYVSWNRTMELATGMTAEQVVGRCAREVFPELENEGIIKLLERALHGETVRSGDRSFEMSSLEKTVWIQSTFSPHFDADGEIVGAVGIIHNVTERRKAEENLLKLRIEEIAHAQAEDAHHRIVMILDSITDAFFAVDSSFRFTYVNPRAAQYFNPNAADLIGRDLREMFPIIKQHEDFHYFEEVMESRIPVKFESWLPRFSRWLGVRVYPSRDHGISVYYHDLTKQKKAEQRLLASEERFRGVAENSPDSIVVIKPSGEISYASPSAERLLGFSPEELKGRNLFKKFPSEAAHTLRNNLLLLMYDPEKVRSLELELELRDEQEVYLEVRASNLQTNSEETSGVLLTIRDVTEAKLHQIELVEARQKAEQMNRLKTSLLANMSHEIHTPLTSLLAQANLLAGEVPVEYRDAVERIERGARRLAETFGSVLALAQLEGSALGIERESFDLVREAHAIIQLQEKAAARKNLTVSIHTNSNEIPVYTDPLYIDRVLKNLVENAIKFTNEGEISIELNAVGEQVEIVVSDTGIGMNEEFLPQIFDEFRQESTGLSRMHEGSGLGLAITKRMVEAIGGTIEVQSERGVGSTFCVRFRAGLGEKDVRPRTRRRLPVVPEAGTRRMMAAKNGGQAERINRVMLVEDNEDIRPLLEQLLKKIGDVDAFSNAEAALECAAQKNYDVVLMDISLPKMSGVDAMLKLRNMQAYDHVAMIAMTGHAIPGDRERFLNAGFDAYIAKPFAPSELVSMVKDWI